MGGGPSRLAAAQLACCLVCADGHACRGHGHAWALPSSALLLQLAAKPWHPSLAAAGCLTNAAKACKVRVGGENEVSSSIQTAEGARASSCSGGMRCSTT